MGNLFKIGKKSSCEETYSDDKMFIDFENALPTEDELETYRYVSSNMESCRDILLAVEQYRGAEENLKKLIDDPSNVEAEEKVWNCIVPLVRFLKQAFDFSVKLDEFFPKILVALCSGDHSIGNFESKQALSRLFAELLSFAIAFDSTKAKNSSIQNDFSYYRRMISRVNSQGESKVVDGVVGEELNKILLFISNSSPFTRKICDLSNKQIHQNTSMNPKSITETLFSLAKLCQIMVASPTILSRFKNQDTKTFILRVLVAVLILYDHIHPVGLFVKNSQIDLKSFVRVIKEQGRGDIDLLSTLKYSSKHFADANSLPSIKQLFE